MGKTINKVVRIGIDKDINANIFCKIEFKDNNLSISGVIGPQSNGDCKGSCGQINMNFPTNIEYAPGWDKTKLEIFLMYWDKYHLNDMQAGCEHQREFWDTEENIELIHYTWSDKYYKLRCLAREGKLTVDEYKAYRELQPFMTIHTVHKYESKEIKHLLDLDLIKENKRETKIAGWVIEEEHPKGLLDKPCPICSYKYGTVWKRLEVPEDVINFLGFLPSTDKTPAWV